MANIISNEFKKYLGDLTATSAICTELGTTLTSGTNLFIGIEPAEATKCVSLIPYPGGPPSDEGRRHQAALQIRLKASSRSIALKTMQEIINQFHNNTNVCASKPGKVFAIQSSPIIFDYLEGGDYTITIGNFTVKHIKL